MFRSHIRAPFYCLHYSLTTMDKSPNRINYYILNPPKLVAWLQSGCICRWKQPRSIHMNMRLSMRKINITRSASKHVSISPQLPNLPTMKRTQKHQFPQPPGRQTDHQSRAANGRDGSRAGPFMRAPRPLARRLRAARATSGAEQSSVSEVGVTHAASSPHWNYCARIPVSTNTFIGGTISSTDSKRYCPLCACFCCCCRRRRRVSVTRVRNKK